MEMDSSGFSSCAATNNNDVQYKSVCATVNASETLINSCNSGLVSRMALNDNKAGMEGLDKEKINQIIYEASKG